MRLPSYERSVKGLFTDADERSLEQLLAADPMTGDVIAGTGGVRKVRVPLHGRGKSGGARVVYFYRACRVRIYLLLTYAKNMRPTITAAEKREMRRLTSILEQEP